MLVHLFKSWLQMAHCQLHCQDSLHCYSRVLLELDFHFHHHPISLIFDCFAVLLALKRHCFSHFVAHFAVAHHLNYVILLGHGFRFTCHDQIILWSLPTILLVLASHFLLHLIVHVP